MKTKKYRGATMREALERVKTELGEDALVLDSRRVRAGGFLGLGSRELVEIRVDASTAAAAPAAESAGRQRAAARGSRLLGLVDDSPAAPPRLEADARPFAGPAARAAADAYAAPERPAATEARAVGVEIAETAPRIVHRPQASAAAQSFARPHVPTAHDANADAPDALALHSVARNAQAVRPPDSHAAGPTADALGGEMERLRAEVRELKFSLGSLYGRAHVAANAGHDRTPLSAAASDDDAAVYDSPYFETYLELTATGLAPELARRAVRALLPAGGDAEAGPETRPVAELAREALAGLLRSAVNFGGDPLLRADIETDDPRAVVFIGPTGVGKTTTLAKLAAHAALRARRRVELITLDTYRIAAVEQLKTYAEIIGAGCHVARSVIELEALLRRLSKEAVVLVDTTGKSPHDLADQLELADFLRAHPSVVKCLTLSATTEAADALAAARKFALYGANALALTKLDETTRPGAAVRLAAESRLPLQYLCAGQRVPEDFERAAAESLCELVLRTGRAATAAA
jgi:flagellar biosynthesis protein FlhF